MILRQNGRAVPYYMPTYKDKRIVIGIDSSKSNTGICICDEFGNLLHDYEIDGSGSDIDVYQLCYQTRKEVKELLRDSHILAVGIENIITKKNGTDGGGLDIHTSRQKITAVFDSFIFMFQDYFGIMPMLVNNQEWKAWALPEEYRKRTHRKGSQDYMNDTRGILAGRKDDVTDAYFICQFVLAHTEIDKVRVIDEPIKSKRQYRYGFYPVDHKFRSATYAFKLGADMTLYQIIETLAYYVDIPGDVGIIEVPTKLIPIEQMYDGHVKLKHERNESSVILAVKVV